MIPLFRIDHQQSDSDAVCDVLERGSEWAGGRDVEELEQVIDSYLDVKHCVVMNSGTSALHVALLAHDVGPGDEVIVPSFTFIATANCVIMVGATPVFAEVEAETLGLDPQDVERRITSKTKVIICVDYGGRSCRMSELREVAQRYGVLLIEDAAEALGTMVDGRIVGTLGDLAVLSFCQNKIVTTGEGGALVTDSDEIARRARLLRSHGRADDVAYFTTASTGDYVTLGYNFRLPNILAALATSQMGRIEDIIARRRAVAAHYTALLGDLHDVVLPREGPRERHVHQLFTVRIPSGRHTRDALQKWLAEHGVASKVYFSPVHLTAFYRERFGYSPGSLPGTERLSDEVLSLPIWPAMAEDEVELVSHLVRDFFGKGRE
ncbi:MAG: DegT/DnrJ/EryC1/StrS family aminotransferase [Dehalococcoidia bacterium]|nr:DegT/DnrJ/EryC1/StrS family aminotransferase [Dehalococcoidia bacterium]